MKRFETRWNGEVVAGYDMLLAWGVVMLALFVLASPPRPKAQENESPPGNLTVQMFWPDECNCDIDLWVLAPGDRPVGYSNKDGKFFNLLRDDLGFTNDTSGKNFEVAYSRSLPAGEYVANVHAYSVGAGDLPVPVKVVVQERRPGASVETLATVDVNLTHGGEELTAIRFRLDEHGLLVPGSVNNLPMELRAAR